MRILPRTIKVSALISNMWCFRYGAIFLFNFTLTCFTVRSLKPSSQEQRWEPSVFLQFALMSQTGGVFKHSSSSVSRSQIRCSGSFERRRYYLSATNVGNQKYERTDWSFVGLSLSISADEQGCLSNLSILTSFCMNYSA